MDSQRLSIPELLNDLRALKDDRAWLEESLRKRTGVLNERVKELECLHAIAQLSRTPQLGFPDLLSGAAAALVQAMQYPERTSVRITVGSECRRSTPFKESTRSIQGQADNVRIDVFYSEGEFLKEEQQLVETAAAWMAALAQRRSL